MKRDHDATGVTRREVLRLAALGAPMMALGSQGARAQGAKPAGLTLEMLQESPARVLFVTPGVDRIRVTREWEGSLCRTRIHNSGRETVKVKEVVLFDVEHGLPPETLLYGEGFQMLSQTGGTLGAPADLGSYTDARHYRLPAPEGARAAYGLLTLTPPTGRHLLLAFTSCRRFSGQFYLKPGSFQVVVDTGGLELAAYEDFVLEEFTFRSGPDREALLAGLAERISENHPPLRTAAPPSGWCSWYCFGPTVTARQVLDNLAVIAKSASALQYVQIDDGYQPAMGDWLETGSAFGGDVQGVLKQIKARGFRPALWVAPFIAEKGSRLFQEHPGWFMKDPTGEPLPADRVSFGGWRRGPWYALDGTHPEVQAHLERVFRVMRTEWGVTYFKLDANFWGALQGGVLFDPKATRIEAYRRGMEAVRRGAGDAFLLGCNHPLWASFGLLHGSRSSHDIKRTWDRVRTTARENLLRNWQNGRLWWNDPDAVVLMGALGEEESRFHATAIYAAGGMVLSGDDLTKIARPRLEMLRKLLPPSGVAARFADSSLQVGTLEREGRRVVILLNWGDAPLTLRAAIPAGHRVQELWTGEELGRSPGEVSCVLPARSGRVFVGSPGA